MFFGQLQQWRVQHNSYSSHPPIFQFPVLGNSLLFFLVYTIQIIPPMQIQEIRMCQKRKKQIHNNTPMSRRQNQTNSDSKAPISSATDLLYDIKRNSLHLPLLSLTFLRSYKHAALGTLRTVSSHQCNAGLIVIHLHKKMMYCLISKCPQRHLSSLGEKWYASAKCFLKILEIHFINNKRGESSILAYVCSSGHPRSPFSCSLCIAV